MNISIHDADQPDSRSNSLPSPTMRNHTICVKFALNFCVNQWKVSQTKNAFIAWTIPFQNSISHSYISRSFYSTTSSFQIQKALISGGNTTIYLFWRRTEENAFIAWTILFQNSVSHSYFSRSFYSTMSLFHIQKTFISGSNITIYLFWRRVDTAALKIIQPPAPTSHCPQHASIPFPERMKHNTSLRSEH